MSEYSGTVYSSTVTLSLFALPYVSIGGAGVKLVSTKQFEDGSCSITIDWPVLFGSGYFGTN
jgi:hypothetical protein